MHILIFENIGELKILLNVKYGILITNLNISMHILFFEIISKLKTPSYVNYGI